MTVLVGLTWDHPRAIDGLRAVTNAFLAERPGLEIDWRTRSLRMFESAPICETARDFDMIILDHPCIGEAAARGCLVDFLQYRDRVDLAGLRGDTVGECFDSYLYRGGMWALPIDATTQFAAWRHGALDGEAPRDLDEVLRFGRQRGIALALKGIHSLMTFWSLCGALGSPIRGEDDEELVDPRAGEQAFALLLELAGLCPGPAVQWDPIDVHELLVRRGGPDYCPYLYGYGPYSRRGLREHLQFSNAPGVTRGQPAATIIGGTGLAITTRCQAMDAALDFAAFMTGAGMQLRMGLAGGQPARRSAWRDPLLNWCYSDFYRGTEATMDAGIVRPRYAGYIEFQEQAGRVAQACVTGDITASAAIKEINAAHRRASRAARA